MDLPAAPPPRRDPTDPAYSRLRDFKLDLRNTVVAYSSGRKPVVVKMSKDTGLSTGAVSEALNSDNISVPKPETVARIANVYDRDGIKYWIERLAEVARKNPNKAKNIAPTDPEPAPQLIPPTEKQLDDHRAEDNVDAATTTRPKLAAAVAATVLVASVLGTSAWLTRENRNQPDGPRGPSSSQPATTQKSSPTDYSDPAAATADCLTDAKRVRNEPVGTIGLVSLVHSPKCDAYWGRAERFDGKASGNHIDVALTAKGSQREPSLANDPDAAIVYTYLLTRGTATEFCVEATFWDGSDLFRSNPVCEPAV